MHCAICSESAAKSRNSCNGDHDGARCLDTCAPGSRLGELPLAGSRSVLKNVGRLHLLKPNGGPFGGPRSAICDTNMAIIGSLSWKKAPFSHDRSRAKSSRRLAADTGKAGRRSAQQSVSQAVDRLAVDRIAVDRERHRAASAFLFVPIAYSRGRRAKCL